MRKTNLFIVAALLALAVFVPDVLAQDAGLAGAVLIGLNTGMTGAQARVTDPILTTHARGYKPGASNFVGRLLFPRAKIMVRGAKVIRFGKESFRRYKTRRAPGADRAIIQVGYTSDPVNLHQEALDGKVPFEIMDDANKVPGIDMGRRSVNTVLDSFRLDEEYRQAEVAQNAANYGPGNKETLVGTDQWDNYTNSDPGTQMDDAHEAIRARTGFRGNILVLGPKVFLKAKRHPKIVGHFYSGVANAKQTVNAEQMAEYFGVKRVVSGDAVYLPETAANTDPFTDIWGDKAILAYVPEVDGEGSIEIPSFGYTYYLNGYPNVAQAWMDKNNDSWRYPVTDEYNPVLTGMEAGYLFSDVLST